MKFIIPRLRFQFLTDSRTTQRLNHSKTVIMSLIQKNFCEIRRQSAGRLRRQSTNRTRRPPHQGTRGSEMGRAMNSTTRTILIDATTKDRINGSPNRTNDDALLVHAHYRNCFTMIEEHDRIGKYHRALHTSLYIFHNRKTPPCSPHPTTPHPRLPGRLARTVSAFLPHAVLLPREMFGSFLTGGGPRHHRDWRILPALKLSNISRGKTAWGKNAETVARRTPTPPCPSRRRS